jgi:UDP-glucose-4-epimerase GalE
MAKILVTGGAGYIGSHTVYHLLRENYEVVVVDDLSRGRSGNVAASRLRRLNLEDTEALTRLCLHEKFDAVVHFAAFIAVGESTREPEKYFANNIGGTLSLLSAMARAGIRRLVFSSSAAVYGTPKEIPIKEDAPIAPLSPYGETKATVERVLIWLDRYRGLRSIALRYFNACGAEPGSGLGEEHDPETHLIPLLLRAVETGEPITIFGDDYDTADGTCIRDYVHVSDLATAHILALEALRNGSNSEAMNVGTGRGQSVWEVVRAVEEVTGKKVPYRIGPRRAGDPPELVADSSKLQRKLGWSPRYTKLRDIVVTAWEFEQTRGERAVPGKEGDLRSAF